MQITKYFIGSSIIFNPIYRVYPDLSVLGPKWQKKKCHKDAKTQRDTKSMT